MPGAYERTRAETKHGSPEPKTNATMVRKEVVVWSGARRYETRRIIDGKHGRKKKRRRRTRYVRESTSYGIQSEKKPETYGSLNDSKEENKKNERPKDSTPRTHEGEVKAVLRGQPR